MKPKACEGGQTKEVRYCGATFEECYACGTRVRCDMTNHPFWGFANTCEKPQRKADDHA
jgi:hypothetical protein